jgi:hypothetical protein
MTEELCTQQLREFVHRQPFQPFVVELLDGQSLLIDRPAMLFNGGAVGFLSDTDGLVAFSCDEVRRIALAKWEAAQ